MGDSIERDPARQALVMQHTEAFREERARRHERTAEDARTRAAGLVELGQASGGGNALGRAESRPCARCGAAAWAPCVGTTGRPVKAIHAERHGLRELDARATWHERRANGQRSRPANLKGCGGQVIATRCACGERGKAQPQGCGVYRVCPKCALRKAMRQRAKFGRARGRVLLDALRKESGRGALAGAAARWRKGGRYTDKMITLTIPHFDGAELFASALELESGGSRYDEKRAENARRILGHGSSTLTARIAGLFAAWAGFARKMKDALRRRKLGDDLWSRWDRFFEWTPGADGRGHPHFHVWAFSPFLCRDEVAAWWTAALRDEGIPVRTREHACERCGVVHVVGAVVGVQVMGAFDERAVRELMAGRRAVELSAFRSMNVGPTAVTYAAGWSLADVLGEIPPEDEAELYCALEGRRLSQSCAGLYRDESPPACPCCGAMGTRAALLWSADAETRTTEWNAGVAKARKERAPPDEQHRRHAS